MINWFLSLDFNLQFVIVFFAGILFGILLMNIFIIVKNKKINIYKRQLEKEAIASDENAAKVKVLEAKIEVLESALKKSIENK